MQTVPHLTKKLPAQRGRLAALRTAAEVRWGLFGVDMTLVADLAAKVAAAYERGPAEQDPMLKTATPRSVSTE